VVNIVARKALEADKIILKIVRDIKVLRPINPGSITYIYTSIAAKGG
jgi:hypothetical protein